jgi:hypothetical protein
VETTASIVKIPGFNEFPRLPDRFLSPAAHSRGNAPPEELAGYRARCFPEIDQIISRVRDVRASLLPMTTLRRAYVLTNGRPEWLQALKNVL